MKIIIFSFLFLSSMLHADNESVINSLIYPQEACTLDEIWTPKNPHDQTIFLIRDAHAHPEAQKQILILLKSLIDRYHIQTFALEGSTGLIEKSPLANIKDKKVQELLLEEYLSKGQITAAEYLFITHQGEIQLYGIEDKNIYHENVVILQSLHPLREELSSLLPQLELSLQTLKKKHYTKYLIKLDQSWNKYMKGNLSSLSYIHFLSSYISKKDLAPYLQIQQLNKLQQIKDQINFKILGKEHRQLMHKLSLTLSKADLQELIKWQLNLHREPIRPRQYYRNLDDFLSKLTLIPTWKDSYPMVSQMILFSESFDSLHSLKLNIEFEQLNQRLMNQYFKTEQQREIFQMSQSFYLLNNLLLSKLTRHEWNQFQTINTNDLINFLQFHADVSLDLKLLSNALPLAIKFYKTAIRRDESLTSNLSQLINRKNLRQTILITGGFHTEGIKSYFRKNNIAYAIFSPRITQKHNSDLYLELLAEQDVGALI